MAICGLSGQRIPGRKNVESTLWLNEGFAIDSAFRVQLEEFYVHAPVWPVPGGGGYNISLSRGSSEILIENGISTHTNKVMVSRSSGAGSVVAYNYMDNGFIGGQGSWQEIGLNASHMVGSHHTLFEGNYGFNMDSDATHGNSIYHTFFRNYAAGYRSTFKDYLKNNAIVDDIEQRAGWKWSVASCRCANLQLLVLLHRQRARDTRAYERVVV